MQNEFLTRDCRQEDAPALLLLWQQSETTVSITDTLDDIRRVVDEPSATVLIAERDGMIIGSIIGTFDGWRGNIYRLAVHPDHRRQGIARKLLDEVESRFADWGVKRVTALVEKDHPWAVGYWDAVGYDLDSRIVRYVRNF